jgi:uncharacterized protein (DUF433 family)
MPIDIRELRRARRLVVSDPEIHGGDPVFRGTRVPVHPIAELVGQGSNEPELIASYPRLTAEMIRLAPVYALRIRCSKPFTGSLGMIVRQCTGQSESSTKPLLLQRSSATEKCRRNPVRGWPGIARPSCPAAREPQTPAPPAQTFRPN